MYKSIYWGNTWISLEVRSIIDFMGELGVERMKLGRSGGNGDYSGVEEGNTWKNR